LPKRRRPWIRIRAANARAIAYIADRKARAADAIARGAVAQRNIENAQQDFNRTQSQIIGQQQRVIGQQEQAITQEGAAVNEATRNAAAAESARAEAEQRAQNADERAKEAEVKLSKLAMVSEEPRGMVITLSGSVLFASNQAVLLPDAERRLDEVAKALLATKERKIVVEGYSDARGSDTYNLDLSRRRAEAVRAYLVSRGYDPDLISAEGMGKARPVSNNTTAEGRANNRRVEIVVKNKGD